MSALFCRYFLCTVLSCAVLSGHRQDQNMDLGINPEIFSVRTSIFFCPFFLSKHEDALDSHFINKSLLWHEHDMRIWRERISRLAIRLYVASVLWHLELIIWLIQRLTFHKFWVKLRFLKHHYCSNEHVFCPWKMYLKMKSSPKIACIAGTDCWMIVGRSWKYEIYIWPYILFTYSGPINTFMWMIGFEWFIMKEIIIITGGDFNTDLLTFAWVMDEIIGVLSNWLMAFVL